MDQIIRILMFTGGNHFMDTRAVAFPSHSLPKRRQMLRHADPEAKSATKGKRERPQFYSGLTHDGLGAINAARLSLHGGDRYADARANMAAAEAYRVLQSTL